MKHYYIAVNRKFVWRNGNCGAQVYNYKKVTWNFLPEKIDFFLNLPEKIEFFLPGSTTSQISNQIDAAKGSKCLS